MISCRLLVGVRGIVTARLVKRIILQNLHNNTWSQSEKSLTHTPSIRELFCSQYKTSRTFCTMSSKESKKRKKEEKASNESPKKKSKSSSSKIKKEVKTESSDDDFQMPSTSATGQVPGDFLDQIEHSRKSFKSSVADFKFNKKRVRILSSTEDMPDECNGIVYWMSRDQRVQDNWALLYAQRLSLKLKVPLHVVFCLVPKFLEATIRQYGFMLKGLQEVEKECKSLGISFHLLNGYAKDVLPGFVRSNNIGGVVVDFSPLRVPLQWVNDVKGLLPEDVPFCQVDAHNIVPCWETSEKLEYGARTIRNKIHNKLPNFLTEFPPVIKHPYEAKSKPEPIDWVAAEEGLEINRDVKEVDWAVAGSKAGLRMLESFCKERMKYFAADRNNPNKKALSNLSPWIHFGQISMQRCIIEVKKFKSKAREGADAFIEEGVIRRELSDNFCFYNEKYDSIEGAYNWARETLKVHASDKREYIYSREQLEQARTHDDLWNAAQIQMVEEGKMHGFLRMYWAKKILEWTPSPEVALKEAIYLNDKYNLDGRDPNGFVGCMWSICGIHDQGWAERPVFGKIRFMNYKGCQRKFDVAAFVKKYKAKKY